MRNKILSSHRDKSGNKSLPFARDHFINNCDLEVNKLFEAVNNDIGLRSFFAGKRNVRSVVQSWDPLLQEPANRPEPRAFAASFTLAHFFDRYFYSDELDCKKLEKAAYDKFCKTLDLGHSMNQLLDKAEDEYVSQVIDQASSYIADVLGDFDLEEFFRSTTHGPNASFSVSRREAYLEAKNLAVDGTRSAQYLFFLHYLKWDGAHESLFKDSGPSRGVPTCVADIRGLAQTECDRLSFVPKKFDKLRTISVQPTLNMFFQSSLGAMIRRRLSTVGIELSSQPNCHKGLAKIASMYDIGVATLDWSEASDRIWTSLVRRLFRYSPEWFSWLMVSRMARSSYNNEVFELPMIGTMGNGFTFPLQTLIFYSIIRALGDIHLINQDENFVSVFGDDCICAESIVPHIDVFANRVGWRINMEKTHYDSEDRFRESCGANMYHGVECRYVRIRRPELFTRNGIKTWVYICYNVAKRAYIFGQPSVNLDGWLAEMHTKYALGEVFYVPMYYPDGSGVKCEKPPEKVRFSNDTGYSFRHLARKVERAPALDAHHLHLALKGSYPSTFVEAETLPDESCDVPFDGTQPSKDIRKSSIITKRSEHHNWSYWLS